MIYDTNVPRSFRRFVDNNSLLHTFGVASSAIENSDQLVTILTERIPLLSHLRGKKYAEVIEVLYYDWGNPLFVQTHEYIKKTYGDNALPGFMNVVSAIEYFAPSGDNRFIRLIIQRFDLGEVAELPATTM